MKQYNTAKFDDMHEKRKILAAMTSIMDEAVYNVTRALQRYGMWENTILIFSSGEYKISKMFKQMFEMLSHYDIDADEGIRRDDRRWKIHLHVGLHIWWLEH